MGILPDLHRSDVVPEWETVPPSERNEYQQRAAETGGWDTPGNRETLQGAISTLAGLALVDRDTPLSVAAGTTLLAYGRYKDLRDGQVADATGTKSPLGESLDAGVDTALIVVAGAMLKRKDVVPQSESNTLLAITGVKVAAAASGRALGREMHTSRAGKIGTFLHWGGAGGYCVAKVMEHFGAKEKSDEVKKWASRSMKAGIALGGVSAAGYVRDVVSPRPAAR